MKYHIIDKNEYIILRLSGDTRNNEALLVKRLLLPYFQRANLLVIIDFKQMKTFEPVNLVSILNGIRKEIDLLKGELKLCSLRSEMESYLKENRFDRVFQVHKDEKAAIACCQEDHIEEK